MAERRSQWIYSTEVREGDNITGHNRYSEPFAGVVECAFRRPDPDRVVFSLASGKSVSLLPTQLVLLRSRQTAATPPANSYAASRNGPIALALDQGGWAEDRGYPEGR